jgi:type IV pilus assembly protein PilP
MRLRLLVQRKRRELALAGAIGSCWLGGFVLQGCDTPISTAPPPPPVRRLLPTNSVAASASAPPVVYTEADFTASDRNRDPFRSHAKLFVTKPPEFKGNQQRVLADRFALDELKLVAIIHGGVAHRAMFLDPQGKGWIVQRGAYLGRSEVVKSGKGGAEYDVNWKIDRIREGDVILMRDDPGKPNSVPVTRVVALRPDKEEQPLAQLKKHR